MFYLSFFNKNLKKQQKEVTAKIWNEP